MRKSFLLAIVFIFSWICINSCTVADNKEELIENAILEEMRLHPEARLVDIYKFFFQGAFGPGHIIRDKQSALKYLQNELQSMTDFDSVLWQPVGYNKQYYRISLGLVKEGILEEEKLFDAFVQSADSTTIPSIEVWIEEWNFILTIIETMNQRIINYEEDKRVLDEMLEKGNTLVHHSNIYRKLYHPHYRIVKNKQFEKFSLQLQKGL